MKNRKDMYFNLERGFIFNNVYISEELTTERIFESLKLEIDETPLNKIYLNRREKRIYIYKDCAILLDSGINSENIKLSTRAEKDYLYLMININKLSTTKEIINLSIEEGLTENEVALILSFKNEGLIIHNKVGTDDFILLSSLLLRDYEDNYENIIERKKRVLNVD